MKKPKKQDMNTKSTMDNDDEEEELKNEPYSIQSAYKYQQQMSKEEQRAKWNQNRAKIGYHENKADVINSKAKLTKFFGADPNQNGKINWKLGYDMDHMMDDRGKKAWAINRKDDDVRKKDKNAFTRTAKLKSKWNSWKSKLTKQSSTNKNNNNLVMSQNENYLTNNNSSFEEFDNNPNRKPSNGSLADGNESAASTQSTNTTDTENDNLNMIIHPYGSYHGHGGDAVYVHPSNHNRNVSDPAININDLRMRLTGTNINMSPNNVNATNHNKKKSSTPNTSLNASNRAKSNKKEAKWSIDQSKFSFPMPKGGNPLHLGIGRRTISKRSKGGMTMPNPFSNGHKSRSPSPNGHMLKHRKNKTNLGIRANGRINRNMIDNQMKELEGLVNKKKSLSVIIDTFHSTKQFPLEFVVCLLCQIDLIKPNGQKYINNRVNPDKPYKVLHSMSLWQFILRHQLPEIDIKRFFYSFGPLIGPYKTLKSPLHLAARKLNECAGGKESHITEKTSSKEAYEAFKTFKWLLFIGYDIDDGDIDGFITPRTTLHSVPRVLKQILNQQKRFLHLQQDCMKMVDEAIFELYQLLLDDDILQIIEKFAYFKYRHNRRYDHKKFVKNSPKYEEYSQF